MENSTNEVDSAIQAALAPPSGAVPEFQDRRGTIYTMLDDGSVRRLTNIKPWKTKAERKKMKRALLKARREASSN